MMAADDQKAEALLREAVDWFVRLHSGESDDAERARFEAWLHSDRDHKRAFREAEQVYRDLDFAAVAAGANDELADVRAAERRREGWLSRLWSRLARPVAPAMVAGIALLAIGVSFIAFDRSGSPAAIAVAQVDHATQKAEIREIVLEDGTVVTLGAETQIATNFSPERREIALLSGEAFFDVVKDPVRPFFVTAQDTTVRVVGTKFDVKSSAEVVHVSVLEGVVEVMKSYDDGEGPKQVLTEGERISAARRVALPEIKENELVQSGEWRVGRLAYEDASLAEIVADINRYREGEVLVDSHDVGDLRSTIAFDAEDADQFFLMIEVIQPVEVVRQKDGRIIIRGRS